MGIQVDQSLVDTMVDEAIDQCAAIHFFGDDRRARQALLQGQCPYCKCVSDHLLKQIGAFLGQVDKTIKVVYALDPSNHPHATSSSVIEDIGEKSGLNLIIWVERKSAALKALAETLESSLRVSQQKFGCVNAVPSCYTFHIEFIEDREVFEKRGFGMVPGAPYLAAQQIWKRDSQPDPFISIPTPEPLRVQFSLPESFDPELIPEARLIEHALSIEMIPEKDRKEFEPHLTELKVILIRKMISDQLEYIDIAKSWFTISDLAEIHKHRIGFGRIGGKAAGMLLAYRILTDVAGDEIHNIMQLPESYYFGSDLIYIYLAMNGLMHWNDQKYKSVEQIWEEYPTILEEFQQGSFPPEIVLELNSLLEKIGNKPIIVRSSSQLEDNFGTSFAGKYDSYFCPNQGSVEENLTVLTQAIARIYASTLKPEALLYRRSKGLQDYDERMAVLLQVVQGNVFDHYYLPLGAGVAFSRNLYRWDPKIRREDGFARLVWGLGTRAVQRTGDDYPHLVALSHPTLQPDDSAYAIRYYSQKFVDLIDLQTNEFKTLPIHEVLTPQYPHLRLIAQLEQDGYFTTPRMQVVATDVPKLAINFHGVLHKTQFAPQLSRMLRILETHYHAPVDLEFTLDIIPQEGAPQVKISLLQCRPQSHLKDTRMSGISDNLDHYPDEEILFSTHFMVPNGYLPNIRYVVFVVPEAYFALKTESERRHIGRIVGLLNTQLAEKSFICVGPGRWGADNFDLGVYVSYAEIHKAGALVELSGKGVGPAPEPSFGTHFFQDLMEAQIFPLAVPLEDEHVRFNTDFFYQGSNSIRNYIEVEDSIENCVRLLDISTIRPGYHLEVIMNDDKGQAVGLFIPD
jgi:hypothetical protein